MNCPLVSVVIPTHNRPQYLPRAVESAFLAAPDGDVEVIVVPNGPDESWKQSLAPWAMDKRVRVSPIKTAHGNVARNHGMALARGKYLRFLDDDDYLLPGATEQMLFMMSAKSDICSGLVVNVDMDGSRFGLMRMPDTDDFVCAALYLTEFALPTCHLFRRSAISSCEWNPRIDTLQDRAWMITLAGRSEISWVRTEHEVGVWFQHKLPRSSQPGPATNRHSRLITSILDLDANLEAQARHSASRRAAIARALWSYAHSGFPYHPLHWTAVARSAAAIDPTSRPGEPAFATDFARMLGPIAMEWVLLPVRRLTKAFRTARFTLNTDNYRRGTRT